MCLIIGAVELTRLFHQISLSSLALFTLDLLLLELALLGVHLGWLRVDIAVDQHRSSRFDSRAIGDVDRVQHELGVDGEEVIVTVTVGVAGGHG